MLETVDPEPNVNDDDEQDQQNDRRQQHEKHDVQMVQDVQCKQRHKDFHWIFPLFTVEYAFST